MQKDTVINGRVVHVSKKRILTAKGTSILESLDKGKTWKLLTRLPVTFWERLIFSSRLLHRLLRKGVHHVCISESSTMIIAGHSIFILDGSTIEYLGKTKGSRPLAICASNNVYYLGEYRSNPERSPVHVWKWNGIEKKWAVAWCFDGIRHIHGVFHDPYEDAIWVTTGDEDHEAGIWRTTDSFESLEKIAGGSQQLRAVQLLFTRDHVYFGSDAPDEKNYICRMERDGKYIEKLSFVSSPIFYGCKVADSLYFSTAVEPSRINTSRYSEVWGSEDGCKWQVVRKFKKDIWPKKYFQYGQVLFPSGTGDGKYLWMTPMGTLGDQRTFKMMV